MRYSTRPLVVTFTLMVLCCLVALGIARAGWISPTDDFPVKDGQYKSESGTGFEPVGGEPVPYDVEITSMKIPVHLTAHGQPRITKAIQP